MLYSDELKEYKGDLSKFLLDDFEEIKRFFSLTEIKVLEYDDYHIVIPVTFEVSLPTMGTVEGVDIREKEPALIKVSIKDYPNASPIILSDRREFPKNTLSHLYASRFNEDPARLCLVRNNLNEWFANRRMTDLLALANEWYFKAGAGLLLEDGDEFDPVRLENFSGYHIYKYDTLDEIVVNNRRFIKEHPFALLLSGIETKETRNREGNIYKSIHDVVPLQLPEIYSAFKKVIQKIEEAKPLFSLLVWNEDDAVEKHYSSYLPSNYKLLKLYFSSRGIDIEAILFFYVTNDLQFRKGIPIIHAVKRPKKLIGQSGKIEFFNFVLTGDNFLNGKFPDDAVVLNQSHIEPFSLNMAHTLSGGKKENKTLFIGAGSLGSKMIVHDARSGSSYIGVSDSDVLLEHNLARHTLYANKIGYNKAKAVVDSISDLYSLDSTKDYTAYPENVNDLADEIFTNYNQIIDTTASVACQNWLVQKQFSGNHNIIRCELADEGRLGLLYIEGLDRNPRIDDLITLTYYKATNNSPLESWRKRDRESQNLNLNIGLGCSSTTTIMSDDMISLHASIFSRFLHDATTVKTNGVLYRTVVDTSGILSIQTDYDIIKPFDVFDCEAGSGWTLRLFSGLKEMFFSLCAKRGKIETGGSLIGVANYKTKTIHIFEIIVEPQGSSGTCTGFIRGIEGLPEKINQVKDKTGDVIGYIGEWHTHPMNLERLSERDIKTIKSLKVLNKKVPIPTCALIITTNKILPFVFE